MGYPVGPKGVREYPGGGEGVDVRSAKDQYGASPSASGRGRLRRSPGVRQELGVAQVPLVHLEQHGGRAYEARRDTTGWDGIGLTSFVASSLLSLRGVLVERMCAPLLPAYPGMM